MVKEVGGYHAINLITGQFCCLSGARKPLDWVSERSASLDVSRRNRSSLLSLPRSSLGGVKEWKSMTATSRRNVDKGNNKCCRVSQWMEAEGWQEVGRAVWLAVATAALVVVLAQAEVRRSSVGEI